ncbi:MAG: hypothetical protein ACTSXK_15935 [Promethearchaeota archaeon]
MAKTGKKSLLFKPDSITTLEECIKFAQKRAKNSGIQIKISYAHDSGLNLDVIGPKDKINIFEHQMRVFFEELEINQ